MNLVRFFLSRIHLSSSDFWHSEDDLFCKFFFLTLFDTFESGIAVPNLFIPDADPT